MSDTSDPAKAERALAKFEKRFGPRASVRAEQFTLRVGIDRDVATRPFGHTAGTANDPALLALNSAGW